MSEVGEIIYVNGKRERMIEREPILRDGKILYYAIRTEPLPEGDDPPLPWDRTAQ